jgi:hypothetical protein
MYFCGTNVLRIREMLTAVEQMLYAFGRYVLLRNKCSTRSGDVYCGRTNALRIWEICTTAEQMFYTFGSCVLLRNRYSAHLEYTYYDGTNVLSIRIYVLRCNKCSTFRILKPAKVQPTFQQGNAIIITTQ